MNVQRLTDVNFFQMLIFLGAKYAGPGKCLWCETYFTIQINDSVSKSGDLCLRDDCSSGLVFTNPVKKYECMGCLSPRCKFWI